MRRSGKNVPSHRVRWACRPAPIVIATLALAAAFVAAAPGEIASAQDQPTATDRAALVVLYNSAGGESWTNRAGWLSEAPIGEWHGVTTNAAGDVIELSLRNNRLSGPLPPELGDLASLTRLNLSLNELSGSIPPELGNLASLVELNLSANRLSGSIPSQLGNLTSLTKLNLSTNRLTGSIPPELGSLTNLTELDLGFNELTGQIPSQLGDLSDLTKLHLDWNITSDGFDRDGLSGSIPPELGNLTNLTELSLSWNSLSGSIPPGLGNLTNLTTLELYENLLSGSIPPELGNLTNLTRLELGGPGLTGAAGRLSGPIPPELGRLTNLKTLGLDHNELSKQIPRELSHLTRLEQLALAPNDFTGCLPPALPSFAPGSSLGAPLNDVGELGLEICEPWLSHLAVAPGTLTPEFSGANTDYTAGVGGAVQRITVTAAAFDSTATLSHTADDGADLPDADAAAPGHQLDLAEGDNAINVTVTSAATPSPTTYRINVTRAAQEPDTGSDGGGGGLSGDGGLNGGGGGFDGGGGGGGGGSDGGGSNGGGSDGGGSDGGGSNGGGSDGGGSDGGGSDGGGSDGGGSNGDGDASVPAEPAGFVDVEHGGVHSSAIEAVFAAGITKGCATDPLRYCPDEAVTRAQMASFLTRALQLPVPAEPAGFVDVEHGGVHSSAIEAVFAAGITKGCATDPLRYCPDEAVTRAQMASFLTRALQLPVPAEPAGFVDVEHGGVHSSAIEAVFAAGITKGCATDPLRYCPDEAVTRAQTASFLNRADNIDL